MADGFKLPWFVVFAPLYPRYARYAKGFQTPACSVGGTIQPRF